MFAQLNVLETYSSRRVTGNEKGATHEYQLPITKEADEDISHDSSLFIETQLIRVDDNGSEISEEVTRRK